jgi:transposase-like protein
MPKRSGPSSGLSSSWGHLGGLWGNHRGSAASIAADHIQQRRAAHFCSLILISQSYHRRNARGAALRRKAFIRKWRLKHRAVADSLDEAGDRLFTFTRLPPSQWRSVRTTNAIERLHEEFKRRIKTQTVLPSADTAAMLFWALLASGQINMRKIDGWQTLATKPIDQPIDLAA